MAENTNDKNFLPKLSVMSSVATRITAIVALVIAVWQLWTLVGSAKGTLDALKLQAYDKVIGILQSDAEIQQKISEFTNTSAGPKLEKAFDEFLQQNGTGQQFYWSQGRQFSEIAEHYERLGAITELHYLEFDIIFAIIPFPDDFWKETTSLRRKIREYWKWDKEKQPPKRKALDDLLENFQKLCKKYEIERRNHKFSSAEGMNCGS